MLFALKQKKKPRRKPEMTSAFSLNSQVVVSIARLSSTCVRRMNVRKMRSTGSSYSILRRKSRRYLKGCRCLVKKRRSLKI